MGLTSRGRSSQQSGVKAKRQLTDTFNLPKIRVASSSVDLDPHPDKTIKYFSFTSSPACSNNLYSNQSPSGGVPIPEQASPDSITSPALRTLTPPSLFTQTPAPPSPAQLDPAPFPYSAPNPNSITFGPRIYKSLPYITTVHASYPRP